MPRAGGLMDHYLIWCNLKDSKRDVEFCSNVAAYLGHLKDQGKLERWSLTRRKLGFGPDDLGEFHLCLSFRNLAQLDEAFGVVATRAGTVERLHGPVYSMVTDFKSALYRDFPDPQREAQQ